MRLPAADDADSLLCDHAVVCAETARCKDCIGLRAVLVDLAFGINVRIPAIRRIQIADPRRNRISDKFYVAVAVARRRLQAAGQNDVPDTEFSRFSDSFWRITLNV